MKAILWNKKTGMVETLDAPDRVPSIKIPVKPDRIGRLVEPGSVDDLPVFRTREFEFCQHIDGIDLYLEIEYSIIARNCQCRAETHNLSRDGASPSSATKPAMIQIIKDPITGEDVRMYRAFKTSVCLECNKMYVDHPVDEQLLEDTGEYLLVLCNGDRVKL